MIRGTTTKFTFKLPCPKGELEWATMKFWQPGNSNPLLPIIKNLEHCGNPDEVKELCVSLLAAETKRFSDKYKAKAQLRARHKGSGTVFGTRPFFITVYPMEDDIMEDTIFPEENDAGFIILDGDVIIT